MLSGHSVPWRCTYSATMFTSHTRNGNIHIAQSNQSLHRLSFLYTNPDNHMMSKKMWFITPGGPLSSLCCSVSMFTRPLLALWAVSWDTTHRNTLCYDTWPGKNRNSYYSSSSWDWTTQTFVLHMHQWALRDRDPFAGSPVVFPWYTLTTPGWEQPTGQEVSELVFLMQIVSRILTLAYFFSTTISKTCNWMHPTKGQVPL